MKKFTNFFLAIVLMLGVVTGTLLSPTSAEAKKKKSKSRGYASIVIDDCTASVWPLYRKITGGDGKTKQEKKDRKKYKKVKVSLACSTDNIGKNGYLSWEQVLTIYRTNNFEILNHTKSHKNLNELSDQGVVDQLMGAQKDFEEHGIKGVNDVVYPFGEASDHVREIVSNLGFATGRQAWMDDPDDVYDKAGHIDRMWLRAYGVKKNTSDTCSRIKKARDNNGALSFVYHTFGDDNDDDTVSMAQAMRDIECLRKENDKRRVLSVGPGEIPRYLGAN
jgi:hypothetical protein